MSRKGENIFKRKDGRWEARYIKNYDADGKIHYGYCYGKTYREAKEKVTKIKGAIQVPPSVSSPAYSLRKPFSICCEEWLSHKKNHLKESTFIRYGVILNKHIIPYFGNSLPYLITLPLIEGFTQFLLNEKHLSSKTVKDILVLLRSVLKDVSAQFPGMIPLVPPAYPKEKRKEIRILSREEQSRFIEYLLKDMEPCRFGILLALLTGMRIGEVCALQWSDISLENRTIHITKALQRIKNLDDKEISKTKILIGTPKSDRSIRSIPMTDYTAELCRRMNPGSPAAFVLTGTTTYMESRTLQYRLSRYTRECGLTNVHFHTLRHTFATRCAEVGFDVKSLSEILGHANTTITLERYIHPSLYIKRENMKKLESLGL